MERGCVNLIHLEATIRTHELDLLFEMSMSLERSSFVSTVLRVAYFHDTSTTINTTTTSAAAAITTTNNNNNKFPCLIFKLSLTQYDYRYSMNG